MHIIIITHTIHSYLSRFVDRDKDMADREVVDWKRIQRIFFPTFALWIEFLHVTTHYPSWVCSLKRDLKA